MRFGRRASELGAPLAQSVPAGLDVVVELYGRPALLFEAVHWAEVLFRLVYETLPPPRFSRARFLRADRAARALGG